MESALQIYENKLYESGLVSPGDAVLGSLDATLDWNKNDGVCELLETLFSRLSINSLIFSRPAEPYRTIIDYLAENSGDWILPQDCESRTFLHDIPVLHQLNPIKIAEKLIRRKSVVLPGIGVITCGTVSLEQAYVTFSSVCFASFVKFFSDYLSRCRKGMPDAGYKAVAARISGLLESPPEFNGSLRKGPFDDEDTIRAALEEAGSLTVEKRLVDSYFGNISYCDGRILYISQTGASLDHLRGCIDPCPIDGSSCAAITASSELPAHLRIISETRCRAILHGHPKFSVILSMDCSDDRCPVRGQCHIRCPQQRYVCNIPVVPGEVGSGPYGLCHTVPEAIKGHLAVIVYGHGLFAIGDEDFNEPFNQLLSVENACRTEYFRRIQSFQ
ncbi:MAG: class II aldolase/adducin family protein [Desulfobacterales bacterium]|nr:class II aldolase/adducin family protein [Desulfobacterales bacterium]MDD4072613.1 class II aldolase/adducin family protein [Desulfobacterales bacterium]MDD4392353.1 class II aldolase/adducin family protein [Desulfobacterales bacterium]